MFHIQIRINAVLKGRGKFLRNKGLVFWKDSPFSRETAAERTREGKMSFSDMVQGEKGLLVELRCNNSFNEQMFADIKNYLNEHLSTWKACGSIPIEDAVSIFYLIEDLSGGSRFWSEEVGLRIEDAALEIQDIICALET